MCSPATGCSAERAYALVRDERLLRVSFSRSLLDHLARCTPGARVIRVRIRLGKPLLPGEVCASGLYAICKARSGWPLRVTLFSALADHWRDPSRTVRECWLLSVDDESGSRVKQTQEHCDGSLGSRYAGV